MILAFLILLFLNFYVNAIPSTDDSKPDTVEIDVRLQLTTNDSIIEVFHKCTCVAFWSCEEINLHVHNANKANSSRKPFNCSDTTYVCCKNPRERVESTTKINNEKIEPTTKATEQPTVKPTEKVTEEPTVKPTEKATKKPVEVTTVDPKELLRRKSTNLSCGVPKTLLNLRILNPDLDSETTITGEVPWIVEIFQQMSSNKQKYKFKCAGTLIHPKVVLSATHCVKSSTEQSLKVVATGKDIFQNIGTNPDNERNVAEIIRHPKYYSGGLHNDIALLILEKEFQYSQFPINSICLPESDEVFDGKKCLAVGWGTNDKLAPIPLKKVDVPIVESRRCENLLRKTYLGDGFNLHPSFLCAGGEEGKDTCNGDGGGPLICLGKKFRFIQIGIISWGVDCGIKDQPSLYTNVAKFRNWILREVEKYDITI